MRAAIALTLLLGAVRVGGAQQAEPLTRGARVRIVRVDDGLRPGAVLAVGTFVRLGTDTVVITPTPGRSDLQAIALGRSRSLQVSRGRRGHARRGALVGALAGAGFALLAPCDDTGTGIGHPGCATYRVLGLVVFGGGGAGLGALVGAAVRTERWAGVAPR
jgi:hypothetical protein